MELYRVTWRHELYLRANSREEAISVWENVNLGSLDAETVSGNIESHEFVTKLTFEDESYRDV